MRHYFSAEWWHCSILINSNIDVLNLKFFGNYENHIKMYLKKIINEFIILQIVNEMKPFQNPKISDFFTQSWKSFPNIWNMTKQYIFCIKHWTLSFIYKWCTNKSCFHCRLRKWKENPKVEVCQLSWKLFQLS